MHKTAMRRNLLVVAVGLLMAFALGGVVARADEWGTGPKTLTVNAPADYAEDLAATGVTVDAYKIGSANRDAQYLTYSYTLEAPFATTALQANLTDGDYAALAEGAAAVVQQTLDAGQEAALTVHTGALGETIALSSEGFEGDGLYLVLPHGTSEDACSLTASNATYQYSFSPSIIALPTKSATAEDGSLNSAYGDWTPDAVINLKAERELRFGKLQIVKNVTDFSGEPATFVFHVVDTATGGDVYDNYASIYFDGGESSTTELTNMPVGLQVTVTEVYYGGRFEPVGSTTATATISATQTASVSFTNKPNGSNKGGHGIENHFTYVQDEGGLAWSEWSATPASEATAAGSEQ